MPNITPRPIAFAGAERLVVRLILNQEDSSGLADGIGSWAFLL